MPHPFEVGECVQYIGQYGWQEGSGPWVRPRDVGVVVKVIAPGEPGDEEYFPEHGRSVVEFHGSPEARKRVWGHPQDYRRVNCEDDPPELPKTYGRSPD